MNKLSKQKDRFFKIIELNKTPERKKFEEEYSCYIFSLRPPSMFDPDMKKVVWDIDTWYKIKSTDYEQTSHIHKMTTMRARFNNATVYGVWLPNDFNTNGYDEIRNPDLFYDIIWKYKFKI